MTKPIISYLLVNIFINYMLRKTTHPPRTMVKDVPNILISQTKTLFFYLSCVYIYMCPILVADHDSGCVQFWNDIPIIITI